MAKSYSYQEWYHPQEIEYNITWNVVYHHRAWIQCLCRVHFYRFLYIHKLGSSITSFKYANIYWDGINISHNDDSSYIWYPDFDLHNYMLDIIREIVSNSAGCQGYLNNYKDHVEVWQEVIDSQGSSSIYYSGSHDNIYDSTIDQQITCYGLEQLIEDGC